MFSRQFMKDFRARKYSNPTMPYGNSNTDFYLASFRDQKPLRIFVYGFVTCLIVNATYSFEIFYELFRPIKSMVPHTLYESQIPTNVRIPNEQIMDKYHLIHKAHDFKASITQ